jgi:hypothetical protein
MMNSTEFVLVSGAWVLANLCVAHYQPLIMLVKGLDGLQIDASSQTYPLRLKIRARIIKKKFANHFLKFFFLNGLNGLPKITGLII